MVSAFMPACDLGQTAHPDSISICHSKAYVLELLLKAVDKSVGKHVVGVLCVVPSLHSYTSPFL